MQGNAARNFFFNIFLNKGNSVFTVQFVEVEIPLELRLMDRDKAQFQIIALNQAVW